MYLLAMIEAFIRGGVLGVKLERIRRKHYKLRKRSDKLQKKLFEKVANELRSK